MYTESRPHTNHESTFEYLSKEFHVQIDDVAHLYKSELDKAGVGARVKIYLSIFALRKVREILRQRNTEKLDSQ